MIRLDRGHDHARPLLLHEADRLESLARDLRRMAEGHGPSSEELAAAPVVQDWRWAERTLTCVTGQVAGHPRLPDGPLLSTEVWVSDVTSRWIRTLGRWYVLGGPTGG